MGDDERIKPADQPSKKPTEKQRKELVRIVASSRKAVRLLALRGDREARAAYADGKDGKVYGGWVVHPDERGARARDRRL